MGLPKGRIAALALLGMAVLLAGCGSTPDAPATSVPVIEHTTAKPPPGVLEHQQQQAKMAGESSKAKSAK